MIRANGTANLFLLNPNGIIFGPNARLNIGGSFLASTASSFKFADGVEFSATNPQAPPLLTVNVPIGLQFGTNPGNILVKGQDLRRSLPINPADVEEVVEREIEFEQEFVDDPIGLQVDPGRTLALVGGNIFLEGGLLKAPSGRIELGSVAGESIVNLNSTATSLTLGYQGVQNFQDIQLSKQAVVFVSGSGGGDIQIQGRRFTQTGRSQMRANNLGSEAGGNVIIRASESVELIGSPIIDRLPTLVTAVTLGEGNSGNITFETPQFKIRDGAAVLIGTTGNGSGGTLTVRAPQSVEVRGNSSDVPFILPSGLLAVTLGTEKSKSGDVTIETGSLLVQDGGAIAIGTGSEGNGGTLTVRASESVEVRGRSNNVSEITSIVLAATFGAGKSGDAIVETKRLIIRDGGVVGIGTIDKGDGGTLTIRASESVEITGSTTISKDPFPSSLTAGSISSADVSLLPFPIETPSTGDVGDITIETGQLIIRNGAQVTSATNSVGKAGNITVTAEAIELSGTLPNGQPSGLAASTLGLGDAGNVTLVTGRLIAKDGTLIGVATTNQGKAGNLTLQAQEIELIGRSPDGKSGSGLGAGTQGAGNAGHVRIETERLTLRDGAEVSVGTVGAGKAGNLTVIAKDVLLTGFGTSPNAPNGIAPSSLSAQTIGQITKDAENESIVLRSGNAGNVTVEAERLIVQNKAAIVASSLFSKGNAGTITIRTSDSVEVTGGSILGAITFFSTGNAGNVTIDTGELTLREGGAILAGTFFSKGDAGTITVRASESVELSGVALDGQLSSLTATTQNGGKAGDVVIKTEQLTIRDRALVSVSSSSRQQQPTPQLAQLSREQQQSLQQFLALLELTDVFIQPPADPGSITIHASWLRLDNQGSLNAASETGNGGNITVRSRNIQLRRQSQISAAGSPTGITSEGNIGINSQSLVLLEGSRIITSANDPRGGSNIAIAPRNDLGLAVFQSLDSIINARGELNIEGDIQPDPPDIPQIEVVDATRQIVQDCPTGTRFADNEFFITGRGGIPPTPREALSHNAIEVDWVTPNPQVQGSRGAGEQGSRGAGESPIPSEIVEATGWVRGANGEVILTANPPTATPYETWYRSILCPAPQSNN
ncbi:filamentous hemagglutinin family outer membrane protein [Microseira wollei NIES-4236]|uniref:Filamentous hemagglutinin family outer membrane protein n=1 Tax=Microseira wollei NIES-4236 TaxID=2530354 RepID=A0AAV3XKS7_9CYAN|nr:filamentous hemagglutinin family outer membrane protein [Microseira wollei NIES-4236]